LVPSELFVFSLIKERKERKTKQICCKEIASHCVGWGAWQNPSDLTMDEMLLDAMFSDALQ
jgi:hypothetical protein